MTKEPLYYSLTPVYPPTPGSLSTAAVAFCAATGKVLSGHGGGGLCLSNEVVRAIRMTDKPRVILTDPEGFADRVSELAMDHIVSMFEDDLDDKTLDKLNRNLIEAVEGALEEQE